MLEENHLETIKTARYFTAGSLTEKTETAWILLHGFGQLAKPFLSEFQPLFNNQSIFIAPEALNHFYFETRRDKVGATWMTKEDRLNEINDYIRYLDNLYHHLNLQNFAGTINALGFSQGSSTLTRWINSSRCRINNTIVFAGEVAPELLPLNANSGLNKTRNYFICGDKDKYFTAEFIERVKSEYRDLNFTEKYFDGGHEINLAALQSALSLPG